LLSVIEVLTAGCTRYAYSYRSLTCNTHKIQPYEITSQQNSFRSPYNNPLTEPSYLQPHWFLKSPQHTTSIPLPTSIRHVFILPNPPIPHSRSPDSKAIIPTTGVRHEIKRNLFHPSPTSGLLIGCLSQLRYRGGLDRPHRAQ
jgi:hypothetical protein